MRKISILFGLLLMLFMAFSMSACDTETANVIQNSPSIRLKCTGETTAILQDYCTAEENNTIKFLIRNGFITELKHVNIDVFGDTGKFSSRSDLLIEIDEQKIVQIQYPDSVGYPLKVGLTVYYFGNSGLEKCVTEEIDYNSIRKCGKSAQ